MKNQIIGLVIIILLGAIAVTRAQSVIQVAGMHYDMGDYDKALLAFEKADEQNLSLTSQQLAEKGNAYLFENKYEKAIDVFQELIQLHPTYSEAYLTLADTYRRVGETEPARELYTRYAKFDPVVSQHFVESLNWAISNSKLNEIMYTSSPVNINTSDNEFYPVDYLGKLTYTSNRSDVKRNRVDPNKIEGTDQLFTTDLISDNEWQSPQTNRNDLADWDHNGAITVSPDGSWALITMTNKYSILHHFQSDDNGMSLYYAEINSEGQLNKLKAFPYNGMDYSTGLAHISQDGETIYYISNSEEGYGGYDIYTTQFKNGKWSSPENAGENINTQGNEISPVFNKETLYFASDWHYGYGGFDIFSSSSTESGEFQEANNPGLGLNTPSNDYSLTFVNDNMYLSSDKATGKGGTDIFLVSSIMETQRPRVLSTSFTETVEITKADENINKNTSLESLEKNTFEYIDNPEVEFNWSPVQLGLNETLTPAEINARAYTGSKMMKNIYSVQVAVVSNLEQEQIERYHRTLGSIDRIYKIYFPNNIKIRVGSYETNSEAKKTLNLVRARGFTDAFIVVEQVIVSSGDKVSDNITESNITQPKVQEKIEETTPVTKNTEVKKSREKTLDVLPIGEGKFKVRLATYSNPKWFDKSKIITYGNIQRIDRREWTIFLLGDYTTKEYAKKIKDKAVEAGFTQAQVVILDNGVPIKAK